uniref:RING-type domain-containing protein n=1 Tax=Panagrellus redivivus TaxID=6233 RepID=A0A7E4USQ8_PANRE
MVIVMRKNDESVTQITECCICLQTYMAYICVPVTVPCGHTFCKRCATIIAGDLFKCSVCRAEFSKVKRKHMRRNALISQILEKVDKVLTTKPSKDCEESFINPVVLRGDDPELIELAQCISCKKTFTDDRRVPVTLRCGHTMCRICVIRRNGTECVNCGLVYKVTSKEINKCICLIDFLEQMNLLKKDTPRTTYAMIRFVNFFWNLFLTIKSKILRVFNCFRYEPLYILYIFLLIGLIMLGVLAVMDVSRRWELEVERRSKFVYLWDPRKGSYVYEDPKNLPSYNVKQNAATKVTAAVRDDP